MPTPKSSRAAPSRLFQNYIATLTADSKSGLTKIDKQKFLPLPPNAGRSGFVSTQTTNFSIGFPFNFNQTVYTQIVVSVNGWIVLKDPSTPFSLNQILSSSDSWDNALIINPFTANHVLLAPWFGQIRNKFSTINATGETKKAIEQNINPSLAVDYHPIDYSVQYYRDQSTEGNRLIIRWNSYTLSPLLSDLKFECVLCENGTIEFRYEPRKIYSTSANTSTFTCGIFVNNDASVPNFRDFSPLLGYRVDDRSPYIYGGSIYDSSYTDTEAGTGNSANYGVNLSQINHWPGRDRHGAIIRFQPPINRRKILPRQILKHRDNRISLPTVARTGIGPKPDAGSSFDDRNSIIYSPAVVNYPTTLPRFFGSNAGGVSNRQNLFSGDFELTGSIVKSLVQDFIGDESVSYITPFSENKIFENDEPESPFFSGSAATDVGEGFGQPLRSKTQIRLSMRVDYKSTMPGVSSSIYYYNSKEKRWQYPTSSFRDGFDVADHYNDPYNRRLMEVDRGFNAFGFNICSGSFDRGSSTFGTDKVLNSGWTRENEIDALTKTYSKSVQNDERYSATTDESFSLPINQPFLIEKAVIEFPIEAGPGWFNDKTELFLPVHFDGSEYTPQARYKESFDIGGPGLTFALFNQVTTGPNKTKRDLILSGAVTHHLDDVTEIVYSNSPDIYPTAGNIIQIRPRGFNAYGTPSSVISGTLQGGDYFYTGSVKLKCESAVSNGVLIRDSIYINQDTSVYFSKVRDSLNTLFQTEIWTLTGSKSSEPFYPALSLQGFRSRTIVSVNNFGRGGSGFEPSGRSVLGREYVTTQLLRKKSYPNVFYKYKDSTILATLLDIADDARRASTNQEFYATSVLTQQSTAASPYLVFPNDRLVLSVSKSRPYFFSTGASSPYTTGSISHDIKLSTGSINITLYGSLVSNGREFHEGLNQTLASDSVHEVVIGESKTW